MKIATLFLFIPLSLNMLYGQENAKTKIVNLEKKFATPDSKYYKSEIKIPEEVVDYYFLQGIPKENTVRKIFEIPIKQGANPITISKETDINKIYTYVSLDTIKKEKTIIVDTNCNLDFSDDKIYTFSLANYAVTKYTKEHDILCPIIQVNYFDKYQNKEVLFYLKLDPYSSDKNRSSYHSDEDYYLEYLWYTCHFWEGTAIIEGKEYMVHANSAKTNDFTQIELGDNPRFLFFQPTDTIFPLNYQINDSVIIDKEIFLLKELNNDKLNLETLGSSHAYNDTTNICIKKLDNKDVSLSEIIKNKYVFIDFWGSWCNPCIASIPKLKELYEKIEGRKDVDVIGIALEYEEKPEKLSSIINNKRIKWGNYWVNKSNVKSLTTPHQRFRVDTYPTYIILNDQGGVVYRTFGSANTQKAIDFFLNLIDNK